MVLKEKSVKSFFFIIITIFLSRFLGDLRSQFTASLRHAPFHERSIRSFPADCRHALYTSIYRFVKDVMEVCILESYTIERPCRTFMTYHQKYQRFSVIIVK